MSGGKIFVESDCGDDLGVAMTAGEIRVSGSAGHRVAASMRGGSIEVFGDSGNGLAGPRRGERSGMRGGRVYVAGNAGDGAGYRLRRGTLVIAGTAGAYCCAEMVAGTLVAAQGVRDDNSWKTLGQGMRRGSILLPRHPARSAVRFTPGQTESLGFLQLLADDLSSLLPGFAHRLRGPIHRCIGDRSVDGLGELILLDRR
jgi:formylmethanofuran dehydrogenase subunit C